MMLDFALAVSSILLVGTISVLFLYYRRITTLRQEYHKAKSVVNDIVVSIDNQFNRQKEGFLYVAKKMESVAVDNQIVTKKVEEYEERLTDMTRLITNVPKVDEKVSIEIKEIRNEFEEIKETQQKVIKKLVEIEKIKQTQYVPEVKIEAAIPIKKEKALEPLTETELMVLETIGREGEKTAPEIRQKIDLTREHTARLMKKLYKDGYLERDTHKMPYVYRLKEEMQKILKKREISS